jgi:signal transduction histidine kinase
MPALLHRLSTKITLQLLLVMVVLTAVISYLVITGFQQAQEAAVERAITGLKSQAHTSLHELTLSHARLLALETAAAPQTAASNLTARMEEIALMPGGYAFLVDEDGRPIAASANAPAELVEQDLALSANLLLRQALDEMRRGDAGLAELPLGGKTMLVAYAPLPDAGWSLALAVPLEGIEGRAEPVAAAIRADARRTSQRVLAVTAVLLLLAVAGSLYFTSRSISQPMARLLRGVQAVGAGRLDVAIPVEGKDETGVLAGAFNQMSAELQQRNEALARSERELEQRVIAQTRELQTLLETARNMTLTLDLETLLGVILDQLNRVVAYFGATFLIVEGEELVPRAYRGPAPPANVLAARYRVTDSSSQEILSSRRPVIIADMQNDGIRERSAPAARSAFDTVLSYIRGWMAVPLLYQEQVIGILVMHHLEPGGFTAVHAEKAMAFANQAAVAVENARLYEQAQQLSALEERQKLARELHDSVSQALYGIALGARTAHTLLDQDPTRLGPPLDYVLKLAEGALDEMRALIFELRPESLAEEGLVAALEKHAAALRARKQIEVATTLTAEPDISLEAKHALHRIAQEALHNIGKHARASRVELCLEHISGELVLAIRDDGRGFDSTASFPGHLGLKSMRERIEKLGGGFSIESRPGFGTTVTAILPRPK